MANKKLYSLRMDVDLLNALRDKADESGKTVSELMATYCQEGLEVNGHKQVHTDVQSTQHQASTPTLTDQVEVGTPLAINDRVTDLIAGLQSQIDDLKRDLQESSK